MDKAHKTCVERFFRYEADEIIRYHWSDNLMARHPFQSEPLADELCLATSKFLSSLFNLMDSTFGEEYKSELYLMYVGLSNLALRASVYGNSNSRDLCLTCPVVISIAIHCFFYATSNEVRRHCWTTLDTILGVDQADFAFTDYFENDIGPKRASLQLQLILKSKTVADDCALLVLQDFETITSGQASPALRGQALLRCLSILKRQCGPRPDEMAYDHLLKMFTSPNDIIRWVVQLFVALD